MAIVDDHMRAYERELVLDEAVRRSTSSTVRRQIAAYVCVWGIDEQFHCEEYGEYGESRGYGYELSAIRAEFARIMAA